MAKSRKTAKAPEATKRSVEIEDLEVSKEESDRVRGGGAVSLEQGNRLSGGTVISGSTAPHSSGVV